MSSLVTPADNRHNGHPLGYSDLSCPIRERINIHRNKSYTRRKNPDLRGNLVLGAPASEDNSRVLRRDLVVGIVLVNRRKPYDLQVFFSSSGYGPIRLVVEF